MMRRRCYTCKCLEEESPIKFYQRTKDDHKARFYCKKCDHVTHEKPIKKNSVVKTDVKTRRRYSNKSRVVLGKVRSVKKSHPFADMSDNERIAIGRFYRKCPEGCEIDHIIPLSKGGCHELSNLQYLSKEDHLKKTAKERTKKMKIEICKMYPFTPMSEPCDEIKVSSKIRHRQSKFKRVRILVKN